MSGLTLVTGPVKEPVSLAAMKDHLRITDDSEHDAYIHGLLNSARLSLEHDTNRKFITQTWDYVLDAFPSGDEIPMPYPPLQSVTSVKYNDADSTEQTLSSANYTVDTNPMVGRIVLKSDQSWPTVDNEINPVTIRFVCGYGDDRVDVPEHIRHAIKFLVAHWFDARVPIVTGTIVTGIPDTLKRLTWQNKVHAF